MRAFSQYDDLSSKDIDELRPVLEVPIRVATTSVYTVSRYVVTLHNTFFFFFERNRHALFEWLEQIKLRSISLRDRFEEEDI